MTLLWSQESKNTVTAVGIARRRNQAAKYNLAEQTRHLSSKITYCGWHLFSPDVERWVGFWILRQGLRGIMCCFLFFLGWIFSCQINWSKWHAKFIMWVNYSWRKSTPALLPKKVEWALRVTFLQIWCCAGSLRRTFSRQPVVAILPGFCRSYCSARRGTV